MHVVKVILWGKSGRSYASLQCLRTAYYALRFFNTRRKRGPHRVGLFLSLSYIVNPMYCVVKHGHLAEDSLYNLSRVTTADQTTVPLSWTNAKGARGNVNTGGWRESSGSSCYHTFSTDWNWTVGFD